MLSLIYAAEVQYRHDSAALVRENDLLARIAERAMVADEPLHVPALRLRAAWPRPIHAAGHAYARSTGGAGSKVAVAAPCC